MLFLLCRVFFCSAVHCNGIEEKCLAEQKRAQHSRKMLGRAEKTLSIEEKCLVGQKNVHHRRKMLSRADKPPSIEGKCLVDLESA